MADTADDDDFKYQLQQEASESKSTDIKKTKTDEDGTVYAWDEKFKAWFPQADDQVIVQYQMNYTGNNNGSTSKEEGSKSSQVQNDATDQADSSEKYRKWYREYQEYLAQNPDAEDIYGIRSAENSSMAPSQEPKAYSEEDQTVHLSANVDPEALYRAAMKEFDEEDDTYDSHYQNAHHDVAKAEESDKAKKKKRKVEVRPAEWFEIDESKNNNIYISGLPLSGMNDEDFEALVGKCGMLAFDPRTRKPKVKLYRDEEGNLKGDGRCCYIKHESVLLALQILDGSNYREHTIKVEQASFSLKGNFDAKKRRKLTNKEKKKLKEHEEKLFNWKLEKSDAQLMRKKNERVVIAKHMFSPEEFDSDPDLINEIRNDLRDECQKFGQISKISIYDRHKDGVVSIMFKEASQADTCINALNGRWFAQRQIVAERWDGQTKYEVKETEEEKELRLSQWNKYLDSDAKPDNAGQEASAVSLAQAEKPIGGET